jgi:DNA-binding MarR family transcriptional regulator
MDQPNPVLITGLKQELPHLTDRQFTILKYIYTYYSNHRYYPTQREIAKGTKISSTNCGPYIEPLVKKGYLERRTLTRGRNLSFTPLGLEKLKIEGVIKEHSAKGSK